MKRGSTIKTWNTPIYNAIRDYACSGTVPFHMPGHKKGAGLPAEFANNMAALDLTEIPGTDNLHHPEGVILEAQGLAAEAFGAEHSYFLVNGSTCGIHSIISTICKRGDILIVSRDCHKSVITGMMAAGVEPAYIVPQYNELFGITTLIEPSTVEKALVENPQAVGVLLVRPNYYGVCCDLSEIAGIVHAHGKILAVDEAHGAHLCFGKELPGSAMASGADICVQSAHKTLPALTQGAFLHVKSDLIDKERLRFFLGVYQTSSPSYLIMSSLDIAREIMQKDGEMLLERLNGFIKKAKQKYGHPGLCFLNEKDVNDQGKGRIKFHDPTRVVLNVRKLGITGFLAENLLRSEFGIQAEMADLYNVLCIATVSDSEDDISSLFKAFRELAVRYDGNSSYSGPLVTVWGHSLPGQGIKPGAVLHTRREKISIFKSAGRISWDMIAPYPPGIPVLCPGETITEEIIGAIKAIIIAGGSVQGLDSDQCINVVENMI